MRRKPWFVRREPHPFGATRHAIPADVRRAVVERQMGSCVACGCLLGPGFTEYDHHPPLALRDQDSDPNDPARLQALCTPCHRLKTGADLRAIAKSKRLAETEAQHRTMMSEKVPGRPRLPAAVRRWHFKRPGEKV
ncbi:MAG: hypothetical protein FD152_814 [Xanthobacteraceae bacterium]|nr:MAG: hypothetical protein FD152_814 [Xanthobacteraceae bacterium]